MAQHGQKPLKAHQVPPGGSRSSYGRCDGECHHLSISSAVTEERPVCQSSVFQVEDLQNLRVCILATARALRKQFNCLSFRLKDLPQTCTVHRAITVLHQEGRSDPEPRPFPADRLGSGTAHAYSTGSPAGGEAWEGLLFAEKPWSFISWSHRSQSKISCFPRENRELPQ